MTVAVAWLFLFFFPVLFSSFSLAGAMGVWSRVSCGSRIKRTATVSKVVRCLDIGPFVLCSYKALYGPVLVHQLSHYAA
jgi:hypothetical protein